MMFYLLPRSARIGRHWSPGSSPCLASLAERSVDSATSIVWFSAAETIPDRCSAGGRGMRVPVAGDRKSFFALSISAVRVRTPPDPQSGSLIKLSPGAGRGVLLAAGDM